MQLCRVEEPARGEHGADAPRAERRDEVLLAGGEIKYGGHAAVGVEAEKSDDEPDGVRQEQRHGLAGLRTPRELTAEHETGEHELLVAEACTLGIFENDLVRAVLGGDLQQPGKERRLGLGGIER